MSNLYKELAQVYEAMYHTFIDYKEEYEFYSQILKKYHKKEIVEIGCGTGNLVYYFLTNGFDYTGLDLSEEMIQMAKEKVQDCEFIQADMRHFTLKKQVQSILITARTISYLSTNEDVNTTFQTIANNLQQGGILCFDIIDANKFIPMIAQKQEIIHEATANNIDYRRESIWNISLKHGMDLTWQSSYHKKEAGKWTEIGQDYSNVRSFTLNEIEIFLSLNGFVVKEAIERPSYFFPTYVIVAEKA